MRIVIVIVLLLSFAPLVSAQDQLFAPCGVVESINYPIDGLVEGYDDFGRYRARFGGLHVGLDIGFDRWGDPVHAAAAGRVTYADPEGWDTEKGVVIVEHIFPDGSVTYTLYGHMEETDVIRFPEVGSCVAPNSTLGVIGWPSLGRPHLHYEIRNFMPNDGGPGYVTTNPMYQGWFHPLEFTQLWQLRLQPGFIGALMFRSVPTLPPVLLSNGRFVVAGDNVIAGGAQSDGVEQWRIDTDGQIIGLAALPDGQIAAQTHTGQIVILQNGRYAALWQMPNSNQPFIPVADTLVFAAQGALQAYDQQGNLRWSLPISDATGDATLLSDGSNAAVSIPQAAGTLWWLVDEAGHILQQMQLTDPVLTSAAGDGQWVVVSGDTVHRLSAIKTETFAMLTTATQPIALTADLIGNFYIQTHDALVALDADGQPRWQIAHSVEADPPPLMTTGGGCLLYTLDAHGKLQIFATHSGDLLHEVQLYAGGNRTGNPQARLLQATAEDRVLAGAGFLSIVALDGRQMAGAALDDCRLG